MGGVAGAVVALVGTAVSVSEQRKGRKQQAKAQQENQAIARAQHMREQQQQIRQARIQRAQAVNQAYISGGEGSTLSGTESSIGSQLGGNLAFGQGVFDRSASAAGHMQRAADYSGSANMWGSVASTASSFANFQTPKQFMQAGMSRSSTIHIPSTTNPQGRF